LRGVIIVTFCEKISPYLITDDVLIQETVLQAIHDLPNLPEEWVNELLQEAFRNKEKQSSIFIYLANQTFKEAAVNMIVEHLPKMDKSQIHLAMNLVSHIEPELAWKNKELLEKYLSNDFWSLYKLLITGSKDEVYTEYRKIVQTLEQNDSYQHDQFLKAKKLAAGIVRNGWITEKEVDLVIGAELKEQWFSFNGILSVYMIGLLKLEKYIPTLASLLDRDDDVLLEEVTVALIGFQSDKVVEEVAPYLKSEESIIFATSVLENIKTDLAIQALIEAYQDEEEIETQDLLIEALCNQLSETALPEIIEHMKKNDFSGIVDIEQSVYSYFSILGLEHPDREIWKRKALGIEEGVGIRSGIKVGRNDPCPCGSGKKYKKCCGK